MSSRQDIGYVLGGVQAARISKAADDPKWYCSLGNEDDKDCPLVSRSTES